MRSVLMFCLCTVWTPRHNSNTHFLSVSLLISVSVSVNTPLIYVTAAGSFTVRPRGFPLFRRVRNYGYAHGVRKTLTSCQQNPILFGRAGLTTPTRLGFLFRLTFPVTSRRNGNYDSNTKRKGRRYGSDDSSRCHLHRASDAINSIITQK